MPASRRATTAAFCALRRRQVGRPRESAVVGRCEQMFATGPSTLVSPVARRAAHVPLGQGRHQVPRPAAGGPAAGPRRHGPRHALRRDVHLRRERKTDLGPTAEGECPLAGPDGVVLCHGCRIEARNSGPEYWNLWVPPTSTVCPTAWHLDEVGY